MVCSVLSIGVTLPCSSRLSLQVGWPRRPIHKVQTALANSFLTSGLYVRHQPSDDSQKSDKLIGLARATSDHVFNATIWDVLIDPAYQVSIVYIHLTCASQAQEDQEAFKKVHFLDLHMQRNCRVKAVFSMFRHHTETVAATSGCLRLQASCHDL